MDEIMSLVILAREGSEGAFEKLLIKYQFNHITF